jgi:hypothetical protein
MERHAEHVEQLWPVKIDIVGFDLGSGLPAQRTDWRDCHYAFQGGEYAMDEDKLRSRLSRSKLYLGDVSETIQDFLSKDFAPIGFTSNDFDIYTSTRDSFALFEQEASRLLPRVAMYFDDLIGYPYTTVQGEWAAISEFNAKSRNRQIGQVYGLRHRLAFHHRFSAWPDMFFVLNVSDHDAYSNQEFMHHPDTNLQQAKP